MSNPRTTLPVLAALVVAGAALASPATAPTSAPLFSPPTLRTDMTAWMIAFPTIQGAAVYQIFIDGRAISTVPAYPGVTQGFAVPVFCGKTHTVNVRAGDNTAKAGSTAGWGPLGTKRTWTVPTC